MFYQRNQNAEMISLTQSALHHQCQRALYHSSIWIFDSGSQVREPDPCLYEWKESDWKLRLRCMSVLKAESVCQELYSVQTEYI